jgi:hypothetical protein
MIVVKFSRLLRGIRALECVFFVISREKWLGTARALISNRSQFLIP